MRDMVEKWIGGDIPLENTDIYGIRYVSNYRIFPLFVLNSFTIELYSDKVHVISLYILYCCFE